MPLRSSRRRSSVRRQVGVTAALLLISGIAITGWVAGSRVRSPEMAAANAAPPDPSLITAPVEFRVLSSQVVERGDVVPGQSASVYGPSSESSTTVTAVLVEVGDELAEGNPIVEVSGRPVVVFEGPVPAFRDMRPGMSGADVDELQDALARVGCDPSADDGVYGAETKRCVEVLYGALGYPIVPTSDTEAADLAEASDAVAEAEDALTTAQTALDEKQAGPKASDVVAAQVALDAATRKIADTAAAGDTARAEAAAAVDAAVLKLNAELADRASTPAERADALAALAAAVLDAAAADREANEADLVAAEAVQTAQADLDELTQPPDAEAETLAVAQAQGSVDRATEALATLQARSGPIVPRGEIVFLDVLPATVISLAARVGAPVDTGDGSDGALAVLATAGLRVESLVSPSDVELLSEGMDVELRDDISGDSLAATLTTLGDQVVSSDDGSDRGFRAIIETDDPIPREWTGRNVRVTFTGAETATPVLVVPVSALSSSADGEARVEVVGDDAVVTAVPVEAGLSAEGFVEVTPLDGATLDEGDLVVVGSNGAGADS